MLIGHIERLQIQKSSLKTGEPGHRLYDPAPIISVEQLEITQGGVVGIDQGGRQFLDVHHRDHPDSKNRNGDNGISIGFTTHYKQMRLRFGDILEDGIAGENILVSTSHSYTHSDLPETLLIITPQGEQVKLQNLMVAEPCVEFTRYAMEVPLAYRPDKILTGHLDFLRRGMRGYYARFSDSRNVISLGAQIIIPD